MNKRFKLPSDDMAFRKIYKELLEKEILTTVFRPGVRVCNDFRGYCSKDVVNARVISQLGLDRAEIAPQFLASPVKKIQIEEIFSKNLGSLTADDFIGSSPDVYDKQSLIYHLGLIYNLDFSSLSDESQVTRIHFSYIHNQGGNNE
ncbi:MAG: hypothetical protein WC249_03460 [Patescibacteria group bacterium]|jgi:hypothetical protein